MMKRFNSSSTRLRKWMNINLGPILLLGRSAKLSCQSLPSTAFQTSTGVGVVLGLPPLRNRVMSFISASIILRRGMCTSSPLRWNVQQRQQLSVKKYTIQRVLDIYSINLNLLNCKALRSPHLYRRLAI